MQKLKPLLCKLQFWISFIGQNNLDFSPTLDNFAEEERYEYEEDKTKILCNTFEI